ncbi:Ig-like domain-containing protein, partial [Thorsellia kenyensis]
MVDTSALNPDYPLILDSVVDDVEPNPEGAIGEYLLKSGDTTNDTRPTFSGRGEPGAEIKMYINGEFKALTPPVFVDENGQWTFELPENLALTDGTYQIQFTATDSASNETPFSPDASFDLIVDTEVSTDPADELTLDSVFDNVLPNPGGAEGLFELKSGDTTNDKTPIFNGRGEKGVEIKLYINGNLVELENKVFVDAEGKWTFELPESLALADGTYNIQFRATDKAGNLTAFVPAEGFELTVDTEVSTDPADELTLDSVFDNVLPNPGGAEGLFELKSGDTTNDKTPIFN